MATLSLDIVPQGWCGDPRIDHWGVWTAIPHGADVLHIQAAALFSKYHERVAQPAGYRARERQLRPSGELGIIKDHKGHAVLLQVLRYSGKMRIMGCGQDHNHGRVSAQKRG